MIKTIVVLLITLIVVPIVTFYFDEPLTMEQSRILWNCIFIYLGIAISCFVLSEITRNCSQVDKIWSIVPIVYVWYIVSQSDMHPRLIIMAVLVSIWGVRLTYNFSRRGAYSWKFWGGEEDYRWGVLRKKPELNGRWKWFLFNLFFISLYQNALILLFVLPILVALKGSDVPLNWMDYLATALFLFFVVFETIADQQQWNYQTEKHRLLKSGLELTGKYKKGFTHTGLWKWMRHPNYMAEQAVWVSFYLFSVAATGQWLNWSVAGCLLLVILFQGSSNFSESISAEKYPEYSLYKSNTGRFFPKLFNSAKGK